MSQSINNSRESQGFTKSVGRSEVSYENQGVAESVAQAVRSKSAIFGRDAVSYENVKYSGRAAEGVRGNSGERSSSEFGILPSTGELKTKEQLIEKIKEWVKIDNDIRALQKEQVKRRLEKKKVSTELIEVMRVNGIDAFDINGGQIVYDKRKTKKPITKSALFSILSTYYKGNVAKATEINQYILDNREEVVKEKIVRKVAKNEETR
jgi:hypothetical protein